MFAWELQSKRCAGTMTSSKLMKEVLQKLPVDPAPIQDLCMILMRAEANVRRILVDMEELGLVEKVDLSIPGRKVRYGWKKSVGKGMQGSAIIRIGGNER